MRKINIFAWGMAIVGLVLIPSLTAFAGSTITKGYATDGKLSVGSIVSLQKNTTDEVIASATSTVDNLIGVVINSNSSLLSLTGSEKNQVQVATEGIVQVLVSDINGPVVQGDHITASPIKGVGMKASGNIRVVGIAQGEMTGAKKETYKDSNGQEHTVLIGQVPVLVNVVYFFKEPDKTLVPSALQNLANSIAGKVVSPLPVIISAAIFFIMIIVVASMAYAMIRSSIISIGRNPLSQSAVYRDLIQMSGLVILILGVGLAAIYLILTRL